MIYKLILGVCIALAVVNPAWTQSSNYGPLTPGKFYTSVPPGFTPCANDFHACNLSASATKSTVVYVYYGATGRYLISSGQGNFQCSPSGLGLTDPVPNVQKACWIFASYFGSSDMNPAGSPNQTVVTAVPATAAPCAKDFAQCSVTGMWFGFYGANGTFKNIAGSGAFLCEPGTFSITDPVPNVQKTCYTTPVVFGAFTLTVNPPLSVSGVTTTYSLISGDGTQVGDVELNIAPGGTISNLPSTAPMSLNANFMGIPSNYCITLYARQYCGTPNISFEFPNTITVSGGSPVNGVVAYASTAPANGAPGNISQPTLTLK